MSTMIDDSATFELPAVMKIEDCQRLHSFLQDRQHQSVTLNCAAVTRLGGLASQMITASIAIWAQVGQEIALHNPSKGFLDSLEILGLAQICGVSK